jgi:hypothetical protein
MTWRPPLGVEQVDVQWDGTQPRVRTRSRWCWRAFDGLLLPLNWGMSVEYEPRTAPATIYASDGTSGSLPTAAAAFSSTDWNGDGVREEDTLILSPEEALRYFDLHTERLHWSDGPITLRYDWVHVGAGPLWSYCADSGLGSWIKLEADDEHVVTWSHYNGTAAVTSARSVNVGERCSALAHLHANGAVQLEMVRNAGAPSRGERSAANAIAEVWGGGGNTRVRVNEWIDAEGEPVRGEQQLRCGYVFDGILARRPAQERL